MYYLITYGDHKGEAGGYNFFKAANDTAALAMMARDYKAPTEKGGKEFIEWLGDDDGEATGGPELTPETVVASIKDYLRWQVQQEGLPKHLQLFNSDKKTAVYDSTYSEDDYREV